MDRLSLSSIFEGMPYVKYQPEIEICSFCGEKLKVRKTQQKCVYTTHIGGFISTETICECRNDNCLNKQTYGSAKLAKLVPHLCNYGYDVMVYIGKAMFLRCRQGPEILEELAKMNIPISLNEVYYLSEKFIVYLTALHYTRTEQICDIMEENGGYILHLDTFGDKDSPRIITGLDSLSDIVLENAKIVSEKSAYIHPFLEKIKKRFGNPIAVVQDMGKGIMNAVEQVFVKRTIFICHFHFLRDIGKDLLENNYDIIRKRLRHYGILTQLRNAVKLLNEIVDENIELAAKLNKSTKESKATKISMEVLLALKVYTLIVWIQEGKRLGNGYGFPFDRQHLDFTLRVMEAYSNIQEMKSFTVDPKCQGYKTLLKLDRQLSEIVKDEELNKARIEINKDIAVFDKLRESMRIAPVEGKNGLNDDGGDEKIGTIETRVSIFREWLIKTDDFKRTARYKALIKQIDKYWDKLFADPIKVNTPNGELMIQPQRTNNILEQLFRKFKQWHMRKLGNQMMGKSLRAMVENTPLVRNLKNEKYMQAILRDHATLAEAFAEIDSELIRLRMKEAKHSPNKIPQKIKKLLKKPNLHDVFSSLLEKAA